MVGSGMSLYLRRSLSRIFGAPQGLQGLTDRSRRPCRQVNRLPFQVERLILQLRGTNHSCRTAAVDEWAGRYVSALVLNSA